MELSLSRVCHYVDQDYVSPFESWWISGELKMTCPLPSPSEFLAPCSYLIYYSLLHYYVEGPTCVVIGNVTEDINFNMIPKISLALCHYAFEFFYLQENVSNWSCMKIEKAFVLSETMDLLVANVSEHLMFQHSFRQLLAQNARRRTLFHY